MQKNPHRPQVANSPLYLEVINFCGSQPCSASREQRYYGLIQLKPRTSIRKLFKILQWPWAGQFPLIYLLQLPINCLIPNIFCHIMEEEDHTSPEVTDPPKVDDDNQSKDIPESSNRKLSRFAFDLDSDYSSRQKGDTAIRKLDLQH